MMILKRRPSPPCSEWMSFNRTYGAIHGFPKRAIQGEIKNSRVAVVARRVTSNGLQTGRSTSTSYKAFVLDSQQNSFSLNAGSEILLVGEQCSTDLVPYTAGEPIPAGAVVAGKDDLAGVHYIVAPRDTFMYFTGYLEGSDQAFYPVRSALLSSTDL